MRNFWGGFSYAKRGFLIGFFLFLAGIVYILVRTISSYDGTCGIGILFFGSPQPCNYLEYLIWSFKLVFFLEAPIVVLTYWLTILLVLLVPALIGYVMDKSKKQDSAVTPNS